MTDGEAVSQLINRYALAIDTHRWDLFDRIFTRDVTVNFGPRSSWTDLDSWKRDFAATHEAFDATQHTMSTTSWEVSGDVGWALTYGVIRLVRHALPGGDMVTAGCWYDDQLRRTDDGWRIGQRTVRVIWISGNLAVLPGGRDPSTILTSMREAAENGTIGFLAAGSESG